MSYTAKQIDRMDVEDIESLAQMLSEEEKREWTSQGYSGKSYVAIMKKRNKK